MNLSDLGEDGLLDLVADWIRRDRPAVTLGAGDDAAILAPTGDAEIVISTDAYCEGLHFRRDYLEPDDIGHRAMAGTLSDLAAMGARGIAAFVNLQVPPDLPVAYVREIYLGMERVADAFDVTIAGGDTVRGPLSLGLTAVGTVPAGEAFRRQGAREGDTILVSGALGQSEAGRLLLSGETREELREDARLAAESAHRRPIPRFDVAEFLRALERRTVHLEEEREERVPVRPTAAIDVSDGLARDLHRLCRASAVGCRIAARAIPVGTAARRIARGRGEPDHVLALGGGDDYELLFTMDPADAELAEEAAREKGIRLTPLGGIGPASDGLWLDLEDGSGVELPLSGWDHFRSPAGSPPPATGTR